MSIGARIGSRHGAQIGARVGAPVGGRLNTVARDALSGKYVPETLTQWDTVLSVAGITSGGPSSLHLLQEASGNPADSIGSFTLTRTGTVTYQSPVSGWSRLGIAWVDGGNATLLNTDSGLPDVSTTSHMLLGYCLFPGAPPSAQRALGGVGTTMTSARISTTPRTQVVAGATVSGTVDPTNAVRPVIIQVNRTAGAAFVNTDQEEITTANLTGVTGKRIGWGGVGVLTPNMTLMYLVGFHGAAAEMDIAAKRSLLQTLGFSPAF